MKNVFSSLKIAMMALLLLCNVSSLSALEEWGDIPLADKFAVSWNPAQGTLDFRIRIYQTWGGLTDGHCGFCRTTGSAQLNVLNRNIDISCLDGGGDIIIKGGMTTYAYDTILSAPESDEHALWVAFSVPVTSGFLNAEQTARLTGTWWRRGAGAGDNAVDETLFVTPSWSRTPFSVVSPVEESNYTTYNNAAVIAIPWSRTASDDPVNSYGDIQLCTSSGVVVAGVNSFAGDATSGTFYLPITGTNAINLNTSHDFKIKQSYVPTQGNTIEYLTESGSIQVRAYPQVSELTLEPDMSSRKITIKWKIPQAPVTDYISDDFVITIQKTPQGGTVTTETKRVAYVGGQTTYTLDYELPENANYNFLVSIVRATTSSQSFWNNLYKKSTSTAVDTRHMHPTSADVSLSEDGTLAIVSWTNVGTLWSNGTSFTITRKDMTANTTDVITLNKDSYVSGRYEDNMIRNCHEYVYSLNMKPNDNYASIQTINTPSILPNNIGRIYNLTADKGYYSNRITLQWENKGAFDNYVIQRRRADTPNAAFGMVKTVAGAGIQANYNVADETAEAGIIYEYRIFGLLECNNEIISSTDTLYDFGFRTPTGDIYGRVTFENGQGVDSCEIYLDTESDMPAKSLYFNNGSLQITDGELLAQADTAVTLQAWIKPDNTSGKKTLISKPGMYTLGLDGSKLSFAIGSTTYTTNNILSANTWQHVSVVFSAAQQTVAFYLNGELKHTATGVTVRPTPNQYAVLFGNNNYKGYLDEVRIWDIPVSATSIGSDYNRYLIGDERGLAAYYNFNYSANSEAFDLAHHNSIYSAHHGVWNANVSESTVIPTQNQLWYRAITNTDGGYSLRGIPYIGNGTAYTIIPRKDIHTFVEPSVIRFFSETSSSYTINFVDQSSFEVSGTVMYAGGTFPVEGVQFYIDGSPALDKNGSYLQSDAAGQFAINVPVGTHEVMAYKYGHTFLLDGRICNSNGTDRNYQDIVTGVEIYDATTIRYIGRVCGGTNQEAYEVGFSLSENNLSDAIAIALTPTNTANYKFRTAENISLDSIAHPWFAHILRADGSTPHHHYTRVLHDSTSIIIYPDPETGEFMADILPVQYNMTVVVPHHEVPSSWNALLNVTNAVIQTQNEVYEANGHSDTVVYNQKQVFALRYRPQLEILQAPSPSASPSPYFGEAQTTYVDLVGNKRVLNLLKADHSYVLGREAYTNGAPAFQMANTYYFKVSAFEQYDYYAGDVVTRYERVPTQNAEVSFNNTLAKESAATISLDENGEGVYAFMVGEPNLTSAISKVSAMFTYDTNSNNPTSIPWQNPMGTNGDAFILGYHQNGINFITAGPNKVLTVLRDPPGSNSYAYLEKGTTFTESSTYTGGVSNEGSELWTVGYKEQVQHVAVVNNGPNGTGVSTTFLTGEDGTTLGVVHSESVTSSDTKTKSTTLSTRFQTSDDPLYVGANGDVYIGYSTNITFGSSQLVNAIPKSVYDSVGGEEAFQVVYDVNDSIALVQRTGMNISQNFNTLFAYTQVFLEQVLIPNIEDLRSSLLILPGMGIDSATLAQRAIETDSVFYLSKVPANDDNFGQEGSYYFIYSPYATKTFVDTIATLTQYIDQWNEELMKNDQAKVKTTDLLQNYSFQAGANIEYSEQYTGSIANTTSFELNVGFAIGTDFEMVTAGAGTKFEFEETTLTTQGGEWSSELEATHTKGFVLAEDGDDDYISVDVLYEPEWNKELDEYNPTRPSGSVSSNDSTLQKQSYTSFIFRTRGGVTACPYEGEYTAVHWPGHEQDVIDVATVQLEKPYITVIGSDFVEYVPSGESAFITLGMQNNSESHEDVWMHLMVDEQSNPDGAILSIDGKSIGGSKLEYLVPAGETLLKTLEIRKGRALNYDNLKLVLMSECQADPTAFLDVIADTVSFSVHFIPSCSGIHIDSPTPNWTYNTVLPTDTVDGIIQHYMTVKMDNFDINYEDFDHIELQYKPSAASDKDWITLINYYNDTALYRQAINNGFTAEYVQDAINSDGKIEYPFYMDNITDQNFDLRAITVCNINNELITTSSEVVSGIKDMYRPRLFGNPSPANGILTVNDDVRVNFNESIAGGYLTANNFSVTGIRNGAQTSRSVAIQLDGVSSYAHTQFEVNLSNKDFIVETWLRAEALQDAVIWSHGQAGTEAQLAINSDATLTFSLAGKSLKSSTIRFDAGTWAHVAVVFNSKTGRATVYYNYEPVIEDADCGQYTGVGAFYVGCSTHQDNFFKGAIDNLRIWNKTTTAGNIQLNSDVQLSGSEAALLAYYPMDEARGAATADKARGVNLILENCTWVVPDGFSTVFDGKSYVALPTGVAVVNNDGDFTLEFWFKALAGQAQATMLSNDQFDISLDENGELILHHGDFSHPIQGQWADGEWHNLTYTLSRTHGHARIYIDGELNSYFLADNVGGFQSAHLYVGAHVLLDNGAEKPADFFQGNIDEIRFWNLYKPQQMVENTFNQKADSAAVGLMLYYPFEHYVEWQGTPELQYTLEGKAPYNTPATAVGNAIKSTDIPAVKDLGAVSSLKYNYVYSNDAIIINLTEQSDRIEGTIVTFTVSDVFDLNGNPMLSPITWTAYVSRNQLQWDEERISLTKDAYEPLSFKATFRNLGGEYANYSIDDLPSWLTASPASGVVQPLASVEVEFTVSQGLNVGAYQQLIYLTNQNNGISEAIELSLVVNGKEPDWTFNPGDYAFNMSIFGQMKMAGVFSNDKRDKLAAFYQGQCVGVANTTYNADVDMWYVMLPVYSQTVQASNLSFRMWDASTGKTYEAIPNTTITFVNDTIYGSPAQPVIFSGEEMLFASIELSSNWNWISFNLASDQLQDINKVLGMQWRDGDIVKTLNQNAYFSEIQNQWIGTLTQFDNTNMFMVKTAQPQTISFSGSEIQPEQLPIKLKGANQWNFISYLPNTILTPKEALAGYNPQEGDVIKSMTQFAMYYRNNWVGSLEYMQPGQGYMLLNTSADDKVLIYPSAASIVQPTRSIPSIKHPTTTNIVATANIQLCDKILVFAQGEQIAEVSPQMINGQTLLFISLDGDYTTGQLTFVRHQPNHQLEVADNVLPFTPDAVVGNIDEPYEIVFQQSDNMLVSPTLVNDHICVSAMGNDANISVIVCDVIGRIVYEGASQHVNQGDVYFKRIDANAWPTGAYLVNVKKGDNIFVEKVIKK